MNADPRANNVLVEALGSSLGHGGQALSNVPELLKRVLAEDAWRTFMTRRGELVEHRRFVDFVTTPPSAGLGADVALVRRIVAVDAEAADLLDRALAGRQGARSDLGNIVPEVAGSGRPEGNSQAKALRRLRKDAPSLHAEVIAGHLTAHAAMVRAGLRPRTVTVPIDGPDKVARALRRHLGPEDLAAVARLLTEGPR